MISRFPQQGAGMKVFKKTWPENCYWEVYYAKMSSQKAGRLYGLKYWQGDRLSTKIDKIPGVMKRGVWQYDINNAFQLTDKEMARLLKEQEPEEEPVEEEAAAEDEPQQEKVEA